MISSAWVIFTNETFFKHCVSDNIFMFDWINYNLDNLIGNSDAWLTVLMQCLANRLLREIKEIW